jgi:hypothetical protein
MTLLFFVLACLVLIYWRATADQSVITLAIATLAGMTLDGFDSSSVVLGLALFGVALYITYPNPLREQFLSRPLLKGIRGMLPTLSDTEAQALKSGSVDWDGELFSGQPDVVETARCAAGAAQRGRTGIYRRPRGGTLRHARRLGHGLRGLDLPEPVWDFIKARGVLRADDSRRIRRQGLFAHGALGDRHEDLHAQRLGGGDRDGAEFPRPRRAVARVRHGRAEVALSAAPCAGRGNPLLRAHIAGRGLRCRRHPGQGHRLPRSVERRGSAGPARHLEQALHHPGTSASLIGLAIKVYDPDHLDGRERGDRRDLRARAAGSGGRACREPSPAHEHGVHERARPGARTCSSPWSR